MIAFDVSHEQNCFILFFTFTEWMEKNFKINFQNKFEPPLDVLKHWKFSALFKDFREFLETNHVCTRNMFFLIFCLCDCCVLISFAYRFLFLLLFSEFSTASVVVVPKIKDNQKSRESIYASNEHKTSSQHDSGYWPSHPESRLFCYRLKFQRETSEIFQNFSFCSFSFTSFLLDSRFFLFFN